MKLFFIQFGMTLITLLMSVSFILPTQVVAQQTNLSVLQDCGKWGALDQGTDGSVSKGCNWPELIKLANQGIGFLFYLATLGATISIAYAGWLYLKSGGNQSDINKAHEIFRKVVYGIVFMFTAWLIVDFILKGLGVNNDYRALVTPGK